MHILVGESSDAVCAALRRILEGAGYGVKITSSPQAAMAAGRAAPPDVVIAGAGRFEGEDLCRSVKALSPTCPVVLVFPPTAEDPEARAAAAGADGYLVGPLRRAVVLSCVKGMARIRSLQTQIAELEKELARRASPRSHGAVDFELMKQLLLWEVKRSRRYRHPLGFVIVAIDNFRESTARMDARTMGRFIGGLLVVVTRAVRDIDVPMLYAEDRFLVFLPHTARAGALRVANRLCEQVARHDGQARVTASVGVAHYDGKGAPSFGRLIQSATLAVQRARMTGGNRVEVAE